MTKSIHTQQPEALAGNKIVTDNVTIIIPDAIADKVNLKTFAEKRNISNRTAIRWAKCGYLRTQKIGRERFVLNKL